jgi:microcompartment protein CcmK/EutM
MPKQKSSRFLLGRLFFVFSVCSERSAAAGLKSGTSVISGSLQAMTSYSSLEGNKTLVLKIIMWYNNTNKTAGDEMVCLSYGAGQGSVWLCRDRSSLPGRFLFADDVTVFL